MHFLQRRRNTRTDEYGGSLENRIRLFREVIEETKDAVGDTCGVVVRFATDEMMGPDGITATARRATSSPCWPSCRTCGTSTSATGNTIPGPRASEEGYQEEFTKFVKTLTTKPVVGVGRFTSPDTMVSQIKRGVLDMIGAARPSIADPFLPRKIEEGRLEDIRECIGCNICVSGDNTITPMRCTQNPTMGEEWRKGWHPEIIPARQSEDRILIVGAGPAGLEAARALGARGYEVHLAEATTELGGRVTRNRSCPASSAWGRVRDYRMQQIEKMPHVTIYRDSRLTAENVLEFGFERVVLATGATWRRDGFGRSHYPRDPGIGPAGQGLHAGRHDGGSPAVRSGPVVVYDTEEYYMARRAGGEAAQGRPRRSRFVTPSRRRLRLGRQHAGSGAYQQAAAALGIKVVTHHDVTFG